MEIVKWRFSLPNVLRKSDGPRHGIPVLRFVTLAVCLIVVADKKLCPVRYRAKRAYIEEISEGALRCDHSSFVVPMHDGD